MGHNGKVKSTKNMRQRPVPFAMFDDKWNENTGNSGMI